MTRFALLGVVFALTSCGSQRPPKTPTEADAAPSGPAQSSLLPIDADDPVWGNDAAPVTVMAFLDFECPFCRSEYPVLLELREKYGPERLRFVFKHYPLPNHRKGIKAALAAQAVNDVGGAKAFFAYEHLLYDEHVEPNDFSLERLSAWAAQVGVPPEKFKLAYESDAVHQEVWHDIQFAQTIGVEAVPEFLINGLPLVGAEPIAHFETLIDSELQAAASARRQGVPAAQVYDRRVRVNLNMTQAIQI